MKQTGTYSICKDCPSQGICCSRARPNGQVESPFLSSGDIDRIGQGPNSYSEERPYGDEIVRVIKTSETGCYFYQGGKCAIYSDRPIDCRLFPLDIIENPEGRIVWIAYINLCPKGFDPHEYLEEAKKLLPEFGDNVYRFAKIDLPRMDKEPYIKLEEVELSSGVNH